MKKKWIHIVLFLVVFLGIWAVLAQVHWVSLLKINQFTQKKQEDIGQLLIKLQRLEKKEVTDTNITKLVDEIKVRICQPNYIDTSTITIHIFNDKQINAFALPGGHIIVNTELINYCDNPDMLAGVLAHEVAHIQLDHVSRKLLREIGMSTLIAITGGVEYAGTVKEILHLLSSRSFDRKLETEADERSIILVRNAGGDPRQLSAFLQKMGLLSADLSGLLIWVSTHPETSERVDNIKRNTQYDTNPGQILGAEKWTQLKKQVKALD